jgi:hypothetical protein
VYNEYRAASRACRRAGPIRGLNPITGLANSIFYSALATKQLGYRKHVGNREPRPLAVKKKISATVSRIGATPEQRQAHREVLALRKARWVLNVVKREGDFQVFDQVGVRIVLPADTPPVEMLLAIMRHPNAPLVLRQDCAKHAAVFVHQRARSKVNVEHVNP